MVSEYWNILLGEIKPVEFLALVSWGVVGIIVNVLIHASTREVKDPCSPETFSWRYLFYDNYKRGLLGILLLIIGIRFSYEIFGFSTTAFSSFWIGLTFHKLINIFRRLKVN